MSLLLHCVVTKSQITTCYCCPARQAVRCVCMYYMLVRLSVCLNHIKGTIIIIIVIMELTKTICLQPCLSDTSGKFGSVINQSCTHGSRRVRSILNVTQ